MEGKMETKKKKNQVDEEAEARISDAYAKAALAAMPKAEREKFLREQDEFEKKMKAAYDEVEKKNLYRDQSKRIIAAQKKKAAKK